MRAQQPLWRTVELALPSGTQVMNLLRPQGTVLGQTADRPSLERAIATGHVIVGGLGPVGPVSNQRLVSLQGPVTRDGTVLAVLSVGMAPDAIGTLLRRAGAPDSWIGVVVDGTGRVVARTRALAEDQGQLAASELRAAIAATPDGVFRGRTLEGVAVETVYRTLVGSGGWVVAFGIPLELLEAPVHRALLVLAGAGGAGLLLAALLTWLVAYELAQRRTDEAERAARSLHAAEEARALAVEAAELGVWRWRPTEDVFDASPRCWALLGGTRPESPDGWAHALASIHPADRPALEAAVRRSLTGGDALDAALRVGTSDPPERWLRVQGRLLAPSGTEDGVLQGVVADISQSKRREAERQDLLRGMAQVQEEERRRIARELHDQVGQTVTGLSLGLKTLEETLFGPGAIAEVGPAVHDRLAWLRGLAAGIDQDIHRAASDLRPAALDDFGLVSAIGALAARWSEHHGVEVDVQTVGAVDRMQPEMETVIYRVVQEALTNVLKHARARTVSVLLERRNAGLRLIVEDDGVGFQPEVQDGLPRPRLGLGLSGIRERLHLVGGSMDVESAPGAGTTLFIQVPDCLPPPRLAA